MKAEEEIKSNAGTDRVSETQRQLVEEQKGMGD
jgi:hypothetical protein